MQVGDVERVPTRGHGLLAPVDVNLHDGGIHHDTQIGHAAGGKVREEQTAVGAPATRRALEVELEGVAVDEELEVRSDDHAALALDALDQGVTGPVGEAGAHGAFDVEHVAGGLRAHIARGARGRRRRELDGRLAQGLDLLHGPETDAPGLVERKDARQGHRVHPLARGRLILELDVGQTHPAAQDRAAALVHEHLRAVVVEAVVRLDEVLLVEAGEGTVGLHQPRILGEQVDDLALHGKVAAVVDVLELEGLLGHALGADEEELAPVDLGNVGALPHVAEGPLAPVGGRALELPGVAVVGGVKQHAAAAVLGAGAEQHVQAAVLFPDLGVAHVVGAVGGVAVVAEHADLVGEVVTVLGDHEVLVGQAAREVVIIIAGHQHVAGVVAPEPAVAHKGRA